MPSEKSAPIVTAEDAAAAAAATMDYFAAEADRCRAEVEKAQQALAKAEQRRGEIVGGARMTAGESVAVHARVQAPAFELTRALLNGTTTQTREDYQAIRDHADSVRRGLVTDGYAEVRLS
ncbi:hypothetical protein [Streptomyces sp. NPDC055099]